MRRKASMSGSTSMNRRLTPCGFTVPSLSAWLLPWVRVTRVSSVMGPSAAGALDALRLRERVAQPRRRDVGGRDGARLLEDAEVVPCPVRGPERHQRRHRREAGQGGGLL